MSAVWGAGSEFAANSAAVTASSAAEKLSGEGRRYDVFLAYNAKDLDIAPWLQSIRRVLTDNGITVWWDENSMHGEASIVEQIMTGLTRSRRCLMIVGAGGLGNWQGSHEYNKVVELLASSPGGEFSASAVLLRGGPAPDSLPDVLRQRPALDLRALIDDDELTSEGRDRLLARAKGKSYDEYIAGRPPPTARRRALLVSVSTYSDQELARLHSPSPGADDLSAALRETSSQGPEWEIQPCTNPDWQELRARVRAFFRDEASGSDTLLFYYSGHGQVEADAAWSYLCTTDTDPTNPEGNALSTKGLATELRLSPAKEKVVILDCCHGAGIDGGPFKDLGDGVAVIAASRGPADDSDMAGQASPFIRNVVSALRDPTAYTERGLTVADLVESVRTRGSEPWVSQHGRGIVVAAAPARANDQDISATDVSVEVAAEAIDAGRLELVRQLAITVEGLLAANPQPFPVTLVAETIQLVCRELCDLVATEHLARLRQLTTTDSGRVTWSLRFAPELCDELADLPWEYVAAHWESLGENSGSPRSNIALRRTFAGPSMMAPRSAPAGRVRLFSSLDSEDGEIPVLTSRATLLSGIEVTHPVDLAQLQNAPDDSYVIVLQLPVHLDDERLSVGINDPLTGSRTSLEGLEEALRCKTALTTLVIEAVADDPDRRSALAVRRLAAHLARSLTRPVVAVCHPKMYVQSLRTYSASPGFLVELLRRMSGRSLALEHAAFQARKQAARPEWIGVPMVIGQSRPGNVEPSRTAPSGRRIGLV